MQLFRVMRDTERRRLEELVAMHQVVYDVRPARVIHEERELVIGYDLELGGVHEGGGKGTTPGCVRCERVWNDLHHLAATILPDDITRASTTEVRRFDRALHSRPGQRPRDEVRLVLEVRHKRDRLAPPDPCEARCLGEMVAGLRALGAREHAWTPSAPSPGAGLR